MAIQQGQSSIPLSMPLGVLSAFIGHHSFTQGKQQSGEDSYPLRALYWKQKTRLTNLIFLSLLPLAIFLQPLPRRRTSSVIK